MATGSTMTSNVKKLYEAIDARNYKVALKLCEKGNSAKTPLIVTLKALTLQRLGRTEESSAECSQLLQKHPVITDENVLTPLTMTLNMLGREGDALCCWEQAFAANPKDESVGRELFNCLEAIAVSRQRAVAMRLYKANPRPDYLFWFAASALLEARCAPVGSSTVAISAAKAGLQLAERMAAKAINESRGNISHASSEELKLMIAICRETGELESCLLGLEKVAATEDIARRGGTLVMQPFEVILHQAEMLAAKGDCASACEKYEALVAQTPNDWAAIAAYVRTSIESGRESLARQLLDKLHVEHPTARGPMLGRLEMLRLGGHSHELRDLALQYATMWSKSRSCFEDLEVYLRHLRAEENDELIVEEFANRARDSRQRSISAEMDSKEVMEAIASETQGIVKADPDLRKDDERTRLRRHATFFKCARFVGASTRWGNDEMAAEIVAEFRECQCAVDVGELECADDLLVLCYRSVDDLASRHPADSRERLALRIQAALLVEWARRRGRDKEAQIALCSIESMEAIAGHEWALRRYGELGIKQIQLESLGWLLFPWCARGGLMKETRQHCHNIAGLHQAARHEAADYATRALGNGNYARAVELLEFHETKMDRSVQLAIAKAEVVSTELVLELHSLALARKNFNSLDTRGLAKPTLADLDDKVSSLNSDFRVFPAWHYAAAASTPTTLVDARLFSCLRRYLRVLIAQREAACALVDRSADQLATAIAVLEAEVLAESDDDSADLLRTVSRVSAANRMDEQAGSSTICNVTPWLAHSWSRHIWTVACGTYRTARAEIAGDREDFNARLSDLRSSLSELSRVLLNPENRRFDASDNDAVTVAADSAPAASFAAPAIAVSRRWIAGVCYFLQHACAPLILALQVLLPAPANLSRKKKKKATASESYPIAAVATDLFSTVAKLRKVLRTEIAAVDEESAVKCRSDAENFLPASPLCLFSVELDSELREVVRLALASSQSLALSRIMDMLTNKHASLSELV